MRCRKHGVLVGLVVLIFAGLISAIAGAIKYSYLDVELCPTGAATINPTVNPTVNPTTNPSVNPAVNPTANPTMLCSGTQFAILMAMPVLAPILSLIASKCHELHLFAFGYSLVFSDLGTRTAQNVLVTPSLQTPAGKGIFICLLVGLLITNLSVLLGFVLFHATFRKHRNRIMLQNNILPQMLERPRAGVCAWFLAVVGSFCLVIGWIVTYYNLTSHSYYSQASYIGQSIPSLILCVVGLYSLFNPASEMVAGLALYFNVNDGMTLIFSSLVGDNDPKNPSLTDVVPGLLLAGAGGIILAAAIAIASLQNELKTARTFPALTTARLTGQGAGYTPKCIRKCRLTGLTMCFFCAITGFVLAEVGFGRYIPQRLFTIESQVPLSLEFLFVAPVVLPPMFFLAFHKIISVPFRKNSIMIFGLGFCLSYLRSSVKVFDLLVHFLTSDDSAGLPNNDMQTLVLVATGLALEILSGILSVLFAYFPLVLPSNPEVRRSYWVSLLGFVAVFECLIAVTILFYVDENYQTAMDIEFEDDPMTTAVRVLVNCLLGMIGLLYPHHTMVVALAIFTNADTSFRFLFEPWGLAPASAFSSVHTRPLLIAAQLIGGFAMLQVGLAVALASRFNRQPNRREGGIYNSYHTLPSSPLTNPLADERQKDDERQESLSNRRLSYRQTTSFTTSRHSGWGPQQVGGRGGGFNGFNKNNGNNATPINVPGFAFNEASSDNVADAITAITANSYKQGIPRSSVVGSTGARMLKQRLLEEGKQQSEHSSEGEGVKSE